MKKISYLLLITTISFLLATCEKDNNKTSVCKVVMITITSGTDVDSILLAYDNKNRLIKRDLGSGWYSRYEYETNKVTEKNYFNNLLSTRNVYTLNYEGYAMSSVQYSDDNQLQSNTSYDFDEDGYLISSIEVDADNPDNRKETWYEYEDKNLIYKTFENTKTGYFSETDYEYFLDKPNKINNDLPFKGQMNANLTKKSTLVSDMITLITNYSYQLDSKGYITKEMVTISSSAMEKEYYYECN